MAKNTAKPKKWKPFKLKAGEILLCGDKNREVAVRFTALGDIQVRTRRRACWPGTWANVLKHLRSEIFIEEGKRKRRSTKTTEEALKTLIEFEELSIRRIDAVAVAIVEQCPCCDNGKHRKEAKKIINPVVKTSRFGIRRTLYQRTYSLMDA